MVLLLEYGQELLPELYPLRLVIPLVLLLYDDVPLVL
jgi:hypothetical protein